MEEQIYSVGPDVPEDRIYIDGFDYPEDRDYDAYDCSCPLCQKYTTPDGEFDYEAEQRDFEEFLEDRSEELTIFQMSRNMPRQKDAGLERMNRRDDRFWSQMMKRRGRKSGSGNGRCKSANLTTLSLRILDEKWREQMRLEAIRWNNMYRPSSWVALAA